jgi:hypothetical protein
MDSPYTKSRKHSKGKSQTIEDDTIPLTNTNYEHSENKYGTQSHLYHADKVEDQNECAKTDLTELEDERDSIIVMNKGGYTVSEVFQTISIV